MNWDDILTGDGRDHWLPVQCFIAHSMALADGVVQCHWTEMQSTSA